MNHFLISLFVKNWRLWYFWRKNNLTFSLLSDYLLLRWKFREFIFFLIKQKNYYSLFLNLDYNWRHLIWWMIKTITIVTNAMCPITLKTNYCYWTLPRVHILIVCRIFYSCCCWLKINLIRSLKQGRGF